MTAADANPTINARSDADDPRQLEIVDEFGFLPDWTERYQHLIDLGRTLPPLSAADRVPANEVSGCQSKVWMVAELDDERRLEIRAASDSGIVSGLIALLLRVYSGRTPDEVLATRPWFVEEVGLSRHLSPTRSGGLNAMLARIRALAAAASG